jgi:hypothetical protein
MSPITRRKLLRAVAAFPAIAAAAPDRKTRNVLLVMTDGLRWQEVFNGADAALFNKESGVSDPDALRAEYWRATPAARRETLMPFLWNVVARNGQIFGNRSAVSDVSVSNGMNFSYPGYSETLCGFADPRIDSNDKIPNPNVTVFEWLHNKPAYRGKVAAFGAWGVFPFIFNAARAGFLSAALARGVPVLTPVDLINATKTETKIWNDETLDRSAFIPLEYSKRKPRVLFSRSGNRRMGRTREGATSIPHAGGSQSQNFG